MTIDEAILRIEHSSMSVDDKETADFIIDTMHKYQKIEQIILPKGHWINHSDEGYVECPICGSATSCDGNINELHFCFSCGAEMEGAEE